MATTFTYPGLPSTRGATLVQATVLVRQPGDYVRKTPKEFYRMLAGWGADTAEFPGIPPTVRQAENDGWTFGVRGDLPADKVVMSTIIAFGPVSVRPIGQKGTNAVGDTKRFVYPLISRPQIEFFAMETDNAGFKGILRVPYPSTYVAYRDTDGGALLVNGDTWQFYGEAHSFVFPQVAGQAPAAASTIAYFDDIVGPSL